MPDHLVATAYEKGWSALTNGELLSRAEAEGFDALVTTDQNLRYQQNLTGRKISVIVLLTTNWPRIKNHIALVVLQLTTYTQVVTKRFLFPECSTENGSGSQFHGGTIPPHSLAGGRTSGISTDGRRGNTPSHTGRRLCVLLTAQ